MRFLNGISLFGLVLLTGCATLEELTQPQGEPKFEFVEINGRVLVLRGENYFVADIDQAIQAGDRIISMENAEAFITFTQFDEESEQIGEACELRLPADAQISLQSYADCTREDAVKLNNEISEQSADPQSTPESLTSSTPPVAPSSALPTAATEVSTASDAPIHQAGFIISVLPHLSDKPLILSKGQETQVKVRFGQEEESVIVPDSNRWLQIQLRCSLCPELDKVQIVKVPYAPVDALFSIRPDQVAKGVLQVSIESDTGLVREIPLEIEVMPDDQYIDVLAAPLEAV